MKNKTDQSSSLIRALYKQKRNAQKTAFMQYYAYVKAITLRYAKTYEEAEELVNDTFYKAFTKIKTFHKDGNFKTWIGQIAVNTCIDKYRKNLRVIHTKNIEEVSLNSLPQTNQSIDEEVEILPAIKNLPEKYRLVFNLYVFEEYTHIEIAEKLDIAEGTSKSCLSRAKKIIKDYLLANPDKIRIENG